MAGGSDAHSRPGIGGSGGADPTLRASLDDARGGHKSQGLAPERSGMQPSKERESSDEDPMDDLDDLLDDDLAEGNSETSSGGVASADVATDSDAPTAGVETNSGDRIGASSERRIGVSGRWFSAKAFALALAVVAVATFLVGAVPLVGGAIGSVGGVFLAAFAFGTISSSQRYVETGLAGALAGAGTAVTSVLGVGFLPIGLDYLGQWGPSLLAVGGGLGLAVALLGHYLGRDLRAGLTADLDE